MKIELVKQTTKVTGKNYWYVLVDKEMQPETWTSDPDKAIENLNNIIEGAKKYPVTTKEIISEVEV